MADSRIVQLADTLVHHSIEVKQGERVLLMGSTVAEPLLKEVYRTILQAGGLPITQFTLPGELRILLDEGNEQQLTDLPFEEWAFHHVDALIQVVAPANTKELTGIDMNKLQLRQKAFEPLSQRLMTDQIRWVVTQFPTNAGAQDAEMPLEQYEDFVYGATNVDYAKLKETMEEAAAYFNKASKVRVVAEGTDITVDIEGREAVISYGKRNVPDGEFFYTPNHLKTEGCIYYDWPALIGGREVQGIRLVFKEGKVVEASAEKGDDYLQQMLETDEGARYLGELGIGTNFGIAKPTKSVLFDEKIGGSVHMALGNAYKKAGEGNKSAIHWDMVKNLKDGGEIYLDGRLIQKSGEWVY